MTTWPSSLRSSRFGFHRLAHEVGQAGELGFAVKRKRKGLLVGEHILAERGAQGRKALDDFGKALFRCVVEAGAGAAEAGVVALQHALLLGIKAERVAPRISVSSGANSAALVLNLFQCRAICGEISRSISSSASLEWRRSGDGTRRSTRASDRPLNSSAAMVLSKLGGAGSAVMAAISASWSASARA